ncbi:death domain-containing protein [Endozoicomonas ascidiicola]|nr:death domain-containing protein [Endozoicomonas ascidiicola]
MKNDFLSREVLIFNVPVLNVDFKYWLINQIGSYHKMVKLMRVTNLVPDNEIDNFKNDYLQNTEEQQYQMLQRAHQRTGNQYLTKLNEAFEKATTLPLYKFQFTQ